jgi:hypothetical protein
MAAAILSSWKEIAAYVGKGVRTVQRWEKEHGLPVRRVGVGPLSKLPIFALPEEIDVWLRSMHPSELETLRRENAELRERIKELEAAPRRAADLAMVESIRLIKEGAQLRDTLAKSQQISGYLPLIPNLIGEQAQNGGMNTGTVA